MDKKSFITLTPELQIVDRPEKNMFWSKRSSLFVDIVSDKENQVYNVDTSGQCYKTFFLCH